MLQEIKSDDLMGDYAKLCIAQGQEPPDAAEVIRYLQSSSTPSVYASLANARNEGTVLVQPRCGVGDTAAMAVLLRTLLEQGQADILTLTIDAHTRLGQLDRAAKMAAQSPEMLNGYPLLSHGWRETRAICAQFDAPVQVRHGSPDPRLLFAGTIASGITSFEGGGLSYNIPYSKTTPIADSLRYWHQVDAYCGRLAQDGIVVDRELFGTLTAVLVPPCIALSVTMIEAVLAAREGVKCISIAYPQTGNLCQDVAALRCIERLASELLPPDVACFPVLHQFMGAFPGERSNAEALIVLGSIAARLGRAVKMINKTYQEAAGVPTSEANVDGIRLSKTANSWIYDLIPVPSDEVEENQAQFHAEVMELLSPILDADMRHEAICDAFESGRLDVPFSANTSLKSAVIPARARSGAIYLSDFGNLTLSTGTKAYHRRKLAASVSLDADPLAVTKDVLYMANQEPAFAVTY